MVIAEFLNSAALAVGFAPNAIDGSESGMTFIGLLYIVTHLLYAVFYFFRNHLVRWTATLASLGTLIGWHYLA